MAHLENETFHVGERTIHEPRVVAGDDDSCIVCGTMFEVEWDEGEPYTVAPHDLPAGKFCSETCVANHAYDSASDAIKTDLKRIGRGLALLCDSNEADLDKHLQQHELWTLQSAIDAAGDLSCEMTPDGAGTLADALSANMMERQAWSECCDFARSILRERTMAMNAALDKGATEAFLQPYRDAVSAAIHNLHNLLAAERVG